MATTIDEINALLAGMPKHDQQRVLSYARLLANPPQFPHTHLPLGRPPETVLNIRVDPETADAMEAALADCERVNEFTGGMRA